MAEPIVHLSDTAETLEEAMALSLLKAQTEGQRAYLLVDASRSPEIQFVIETLTDDALCLFDGQAFEDLSGYAPWLVPLTLDNDGVLSWFMDNGWGKDWGLLLIGGPDAKKVKTSLKRSIRVKTEDDQELFFKFYRPSVFNTYIPALDPQQASYVMRDLAQVWTENADNPALVHRYAIRQDSLRRADLQLTLEEEDA